MPLCCADAVAALITKLGTESSKQLMPLCCVGAVAARLRVYDSGICFVCSHLSSGENEGDELKRNYDYSEIVRRGQFPPDSAVLDPETSISASPGADSTLQVTNPQPLGSNIMTMCALSDEVSRIQIAATPPESSLTRPVWCCTSQVTTRMHTASRDQLCPDSCDPLPPPPPPLEPSLATPCCCCCCLL